MFGLRGVSVATGLALLAPAPAQAFDCAMWLQCCLQVVDAHREAGVTGRDLLIAEQTCHAHEGLAAIPDQQELFCIQAWEIISLDAFQDYQAGRIGFYPESCLEDPTGLDEPVPMEDGDIPQEDPAEAAPAQE